MEFTPIDPTGKKPEQLLAEIAHAVNKTHDCVHRGQTAITADVQAVKDSLDTVKGEITGIKTTQDIDSGRITTLAKMLGAEKTPKGEKPPKGRSIAGWSGWQMVGATGGMVLLYKIAEPLLEPIFQAIHQAIMAAH